MPVKLNYVLDKTQSKTLYFSANEGEKTISVPVSKGQHVLTLKLIDPIMNQFMVIDFNEKNLKPLKIAEEEVYYRATRKHPIVFKVQGPAFFRIQEKYRQEESTRYIAVEEGIQTIYLYPKKKYKSGLFRIHQRVYGAKSVQALPMMVMQRYQPVPKAYIHVEAVKPTKKVRLIDGLKLGAQQDGTWGLTGGYVRRKDVLEEEVTSIDLEKFEFLSLEHFYFSEHLQTYFNTRIEQHIRENGGAAFGIEERINYRPVWLPLNFRLLSKNYFQNPNGNRYIPFNGKQQWSTSWVASVFQKRNFTPKVYHLPEASLLLRDMSLDSSGPYNPKDIDQDVYTSYISDHRKIIELTDTIYYRPWLDSLAFVTASTGFNTHLSSLRSNFSLGWRQLFAYTQADFSYNYARYYPEDLLRRTFSLNLMLTRWQNANDLFRLDFQIQRDIDVKTTMGFLTLSWYSSDGRGYRDIAESFQNFRDLYVRQIPDCPNNQIILRD